MGENGEEHTQEKNTEVLRHYLNMSGPVKAHLPRETNNPVNATAKHSYFLRAKGPPRSSPSINGELVVSDDKERRAVIEPSNHDHPSLTEEEDLIANCLVMLSNKPGDQSGPHQPAEKGVAAFQCKACKKLFASHQALGGHRASHKKIKGCFAARPPDEEEITAEEDSGLAENQPLAAARPVKRTKMHECSVCRRVFTSGQALGGHKRCHWLTTSADSAFIPSFQELRYDHRKAMFLHASECDRQLELNLNLPALESKGQNGSEMNKLRRLSDLPDVKCGDRWLQMGIASAAEF